MSVGVSHDSNNPSEINYLAGYIIDNVERAKSKGLDILYVEEAEYAIVELHGIVPDCIHKGWKYALEVFLPEHGYQVGCVGLYWPRRKPTENCFSNL